MWYVSGNGTTSANPSGPTAPQNALSSSTHHISGGAIAGIVVGIIVLLCLCVIATLVVIRRRRRRDKLLEMETAAQPYEPVPEEHSQMQEAQFGRPLTQRLSMGKHQPVQLPSPSGRITPATSIDPPTTLPWHSASRSASSIGTPIPARTSSDGNYGHSADGRAIVVDISAFQSLVERMDRVLTSHPSGTERRMDGVDEEPPRYEG